MNTWTAARSPILTRALAQGWVGTTDISNLKRQPIGADVWLEEKEPVHPDNQPCGMRIRRRPWGREILTETGADPDWMAI